PSGAQSLSIWREQPSSLTRHYRHRDLAGAISGHRLAVRRSSRSRFVQLLGSIVRNNSNRSVGHPSFADRMELVCDGCNNAILFTLYMVPVNLLDNLLRPLVAKGLKTPMPIVLVGVLGGTLVHGMIGLFVGPIVLSIAWQLLVVWTQDATQRKGVVG